MPGECPPLSSTPGSAGASRYRGLVVVDLSAVSLQVCDSMGVCCVCRSVLCLQVFGYTNLTNQSN